MKYYYDFNKLIFKQICVRRNEGNCCTLIFLCQVCYSSQIALSNLHNFFRSSLLMKISIPRSVCSTNACKCTFTIQHCIIFSFSKINIDRYMMGSTTGSLDIEILCTLLSLYLQLTRYVFSVVRSPSM